MKDYGFAVIGAGNLGTRLALALRDSGFLPTRIISRTAASAERLSIKLGCDFSTEYQIPVHTDVLFICTNDDAIPAVVRELKDIEIPLVHCSGSTPVTVLSASHKKFGVFYPLQTFTSGVELNWKEIPILLESSDESVNTLLSEMARTLSDKVYFADSETRLKSHVAAVFAANFSNHFFSIAETLLEDSGLDREILHPLLDEMTRKVKKYGAFLSQTGPAMRNDRMIMDSHLRILKDDPSLQKLYKFVSARITGLYHD